MENFVRPRPVFPKRAVVTGGMPYGNKLLHFGHVGMMLRADVFARFLRDRIGKDNVIFVSGTDCYGSPAIESFRKLKEEGKIDEAYDYNNGLLLSSQIDAYFDKYDISFDSDGNVLINDYEIHDSDILCWMSNFKLDKKILNPERLKYLEWHRNKFKEKAIKSKNDIDKFYNKEFNKKTSNQEE